MVRFGGRSMTAPTDSMGGAVWRVVEGADPYKMNDRNVGDGDHTVPRGEQERAVNDRPYTRHRQSS